MRPSNFPTVRLAQLAMLVHESLHLFSKIKESGDVNTIKKLLQVRANDYWHYHYVFDEATAFKKKKLGDQMIENILINTVIPMLFTYGHLHNENVFTDKALQWLEHIKAEKNTITKHWKSFGVSNENALESQALIELKNNYCDLRKCLECAVGNAILKTELKMPVNLHRRHLE